MDEYIFRLSDRERRFVGVAVIFDSELPQVWRRLPSDKAAVPTQLPFRPMDAVQLRRELQQVTPATNIDSELGQSTLRLNVLRDVSVTPNSEQYAFVEKRAFQMFHLDEHTCRMRVDRVYDDLARSASIGRATE